MISNSAFLGPRSLKSSSFSFRHNHVNVKVVEGKFGIPIKARNKLIKWLSTLKSQDRVDNFEKFDGWNKKKFELSFHIPETSDRRDWLRTLDFASQEQLISSLLSAQNYDYKQAFDIVAVYFAEKEDSSQLLRVYIGHVLRKYILEKDDEKVSSILYLINLDRLLETPERNEDYLLGCLITAYSKVGDINSAQKWFDLHFSVEQNKRNQTKSNSLNITVNHSLMEAYAAKGELKQVFAMHSDISARQQVLPTTKTMNILLKSVLKSNKREKRKLSYIQQVRDEMNLLGIQMNSETHCLLLRSFDSLDKVKEYCSEHKKQFTERVIMELFATYVKFDQLTAIPPLLTELDLTELSFNYLLLLCVKHRKKTLYENIWSYGIRHSIPWSTKVSRAYKYIDLEPLDTNKDEDELF